MQEREKATFDRFLDRCKNAYEDSFVGMFNNPFRDLAWQEQENERLQQTAERTEESIPEEEPKETDPLVLNKYSAE